MHGGIELLVPSSRFTFFVFGLLPPVYNLSVFLSKVCTPGVVLSHGSMSFVKVSIVGFGSAPGSKRPSCQLLEIRRDSPAFKNVSPPVPIHRPLGNQV